MVPKPSMSSTIATILFSTLAIVVLTGIIIIIRNSIKISSTYKFFKNKVKNKKLQVSKINSVNKIEVDGKPKLAKEFVFFK